MKLVRVSDRNHARLKSILLHIIARDDNPATTYDDAVEELLDDWEEKEAGVKP
jgi:hypothetical protein